MLIFQHSLPQMIPFLRVWSSNKICELILFNIRRGDTGKQRCARGQTVPDTLDADGTGASSGSNNYWKSYVSLSGHIIFSSTDS